MFGAPITKGGTVMRKFIVLVMLLSLMTISPLFSEENNDYSGFFTDDGCGSVFIDVSNQYAKGSIVVHDLMIKKARWLEANPRKKLIAVSSIRSVSGHVEGLIMHYVFYQKTEIDPPDSGDYSSFVKDDGKGSVFIRMNNIENRNMENNFNKSEVINDLFVKKAWWIKNNPDKRIISIDPFYNPGNRIYGLFIYYGRR